jgi:DNA-binding response OmpR family regulator
VTTILVAEDDTAISEPLVRALRRDGYDVVRAFTGGGALAAVSKSSVSLVILDLGLPGMDGLEVCRRLRSAGRKTSVLMLTARTDEVDFVVGLDAGADDYVGKPFRMTELMARVRALLRRQQPAERLSVGGVVLDGAGRRVTVEGVDVALSPKEFELLQLLMSNVDRVVTREEIVDEIWGDRDVLNSKTLDMHISSLRHKLAMDREEPLELRIATVRGSGLRFNS